MGVEYVYLVYLAALLHPPSGFWDEVYFYLANDNGTPDLEDDTLLYKSVSLLFTTGTWDGFNIGIPSHRTTRPGTWYVHRMPMSPFMGASDDQVWNAVITGVDYVALSVGNPNGNAVPDTYNFGLDTVVLGMDSAPRGSFCHPANPNSTGQPAILRREFQQWPNTDINLEVDGGPPQEFGYLICSEDSNVAGMPFSNGQLCLAVGGNNRVGRYNVAGSVLNSLGRFDAQGVLQNVAGTAADGTGFDVPRILPFQGAGMAVSGQRICFQLWYRDGAAGVGHSNLSNGLCIVFL